MLGLGCKVWAQPKGKEEQLPLLLCRHQGLEDDASFDWKPVECAEERCDMGQLRKVEHKAGCGIMDKLQVFDGTRGEPSQQRVALV